MKRFSEDEYRLLSGSAFNDLLQNDAELKELESLRYDKSVHACVVLETLGLGQWFIGKLPVMPLTAAKWAFLWILGNGFASGRSDPPDLSDSDIDVMLYILSVPDLSEINCALHEIPAKAANYRFAPQLQLSDVIIEINTMIQQAFLPLAMLPGRQENSEDVYFDEIWLTCVAGCAARESGMRLDYCMHKMSLSSVFALYVNYRRREGSEAQQIKYPVSAEIEQKISERVDLLASEYLNELLTDTRVKNADHL